MEKIKESHELMCRLCLTAVKPESLSNIVDTKNILPDKIKALIGIDIYEDIRYPQKICMECRTNLEGCYTFRMKCLISQIRFKKEFIDKLKIVEGTPSIETVLIKEEVIDSTNLEVKNEKEPVKDTITSLETDGWSDDYYFQIENPDDLENCIKSLVNPINDDEEFFELITVIDDDEEEGLTSLSEDQDMVKSESVENVETNENDFNEDRAFSSESEPDLFGFDEPEEAPVVKKRKYRERILPNPDLKERREQDRLAAIAWRASSHIKKIQKLAEKKEVCHICGKVFNKKLIQYHFNLHNGDRPFACTVDGCDKSFYSPRKEIKHRRRHFEPKCICKECGMKFYDADYLKRHMLRHTKQWKFECTFCAKKCANGYNLRVHMRIHTGEKKFSCNLCKEAFAYNSLLKAHKVKCEKQFEEQDEEEEEEQSEE